MYDLMIVSFAVIFFFTFVYQHYDAHLRCAFGNCRYNEKRNHAIQIFIPSLYFTLFSFDYLRLHFRSTYKGYPEKGSPTDDICDQKCNDYPDDCRGGRYFPMLQ